MEPRAHAGTVRQFAGFARAIGLDLAACLEPDLLSWVQRADVLEHVPAHVIVDVLQIAAAVTRRADLGTSFAAWSNLRGYGPLSLLWDHCPTFADVIRVASKYLSLENQALGTVVEHEGDEVALRHFTLVPARFGSSVFLEATLALNVRLAREMFGPSWKPLRLELTHARHARDRHREPFFACPIVYGAPRSALILTRADLARPQPGANPQMLAYLEEHVLKLSAAQAGDFVTEVERMVRAHLAGAGADVDHIAQLMALSRRTFQRRLSAEGLTFPDLLRRVRTRIAETYFQEEAAPNLKDLAHRLGFRDAGGAGRFLRTHLEAARRLKAARRRQDR